MNGSIEAIWRSDAERRRKLKMLSVIVASVFIVVLVGAWALIVQPLFTSVKIDDSAMPADPARLETHVRTLSEAFSPRDHKHPENLDRAAEYIRLEFEKAGGKASYQVFEANGSTYRNVMSLFGPADKERIVVGAHYDAVIGTPGADDNASGVAGLIELAYMLGKAELPVCVELIAYSLEEPPYFRTPQMGSAVHASALKKEGKSVRLMISLEMIGYFSDAPNSQKFPVSFLNLFYPSQGNFIAIVGSLDNGLTVRRVKAAMKSASELPVYSINAPSSIPGIDFSDHLSYWEVGYNAIMVSDTAFYRNRNYHTVLDSAEKLDYKRMAMVVQGVYKAVLAAAQ